MNSKKQHWETVYETKTPQEVSWTQSKPQTSLDFIASCNLDKSAKIIDVGGGESLLVDFLLKDGFTDITVLDISSIALEKAKKRVKEKFGEKSNYVTWIVSDVTAFEPKTNFDLWHDRATFHFLTAPNDISKYIQIVEKFVSKNLVIATFSKEGAKKCSGLEVSQYNEESLTAQFKSFKKISCLQEDHTTPFDTKQNFLFCSFERV
ncbi:class I SAM-dependent methyltransferase [Bernardetia sp. ABR2-2B]|uniref:class I SAM-dependent methyltransferase n=1 Tax=Bernardetia sp. ABR2-2B TaxID=3127472 RepID=UPI0030CB5CD7